VSGARGFHHPREGVESLINSRKGLHFVEVSLAANFIDRLRTAELRVTRPRIAVLYAVHTNPHSDTETIIFAVRNCVSDVSRQAVYDILHTLTDAGLLRRVQPPGLVARYESRVGDNHHHMVCRVCGVIADVDCAVSDTLCLAPSDANGFQLDQTEVIYWGRCSGCSVPHVSQPIGDHSPIEQLPDDMPSSDDIDNLPPSNGQPLSTPTPRPGEWLAPGPLTPITLLKATGIGTGGLGANAGWARYDVSDATVASNGPRVEPSVPRSSTSM